MRVMERRTLLAAGLTMAALASFTPAIADPGVSVSAAGVTRLVAGFDGRVIATMATRYADAREAAATGVTRCSGGRTNCSLVDRLALTVGGLSVEVPERAIVFLSDVSRAALNQVSRDRFELRLACGDAAAAYDARLFFTASRVDRMEIWSAEAGVLAQVTRFNDLPHAFR